LGHHTASGRDAALSNDWVDNFVTTTYGIIAVTGRRQPRPELGVTIDNGTSAN